MKLPLFRTAQIHNINAKSKKPATISVRITRTKSDLFYVRKVQSSNEVVGYRDPETDLFVTKLRKDDTTSNLPHNLFRDLAWQYAKEAVNDKLNELSTLYDVDMDAYAVQYKPLDKIERELSEYLADKHDFFIDLDKQIAVIKSNTRPNVNEFLLYADDKIEEDMFATIRLPYNNPRNMELTKEDTNIVESFLSVFLDDYNIKVLAWYLGAMLCNIPIYDERISKMLIVSSAHGGSGKNTLINSLSNALLTGSYRDIKSSFDTFFLMNNRFGTSQLMPLRLIQYSEAEFNDVPNGKHNFDGLNISEIKSLISEGYVASEKKYDDMMTTRLSSLHVVLTNNPPVIDNDRSALNRRLLALVVKPSSMAKKGESLGLSTEQQVYQYIEEHKQSFANYFAHFFMDNEYAFTQLDYNHEDTMDDIAFGQEEYIKQVNLEDKSLLELGHNDIPTVIAELCRRKKLDATQLIHEISNEKREPSHDDIRWDDDILYVSSKKDFFIKYGALLPLRSILQSVYGAPVKKYGQRMFKLEVKHG